MKELSWTRPSLVLLAVFSILSAFLVGSSSSQDARAVREATEVGRYQMVNGGQIFDTKTARLWQFDNNLQKWNREDAPWEWNQKPHQSLPGIQPNDGARPLQPREQR
jgi:hypothetical protein